MKLNRVVVSVIVSLSILGSAGIISAASANISHTYYATKPVMSGAIVSLDKTKLEQVEPATRDNANRLVGVIVEQDDSLLAFTENSGKVRVATSGSVSVLVSDFSGQIKRGDQIGASPFAGIGIKAGKGNRIIGTAQTNFDKQSQSVTTRIQDNKGKSKDIRIGYIRLNIDIGTSSNQLNNEKLSVLQKLGRSLTGKTISTTRIIASLVIALIAFVSLITLLHAAVYGSLVSIGRNPLARYIVYKDLIFVLVTAFTIAIVAGATIVLLLQ